MSCRIGYTETDFNLGIFDKELLSPEQRGEDGEDDAADHADDAWTSHGIACAAAFGDEDHMAALMGPTRFDAIMRAHMREVRRMSRPRRGNTVITVFRGTP
jgi:hypothetical protein